MSHHIEQYDITIVGGGMVGAAVALGLGRAGWSVALIEQDLPVEFEPDSPPDLRVSAISSASVNFLRSLGVWEGIRAMRVTPYRHLQTWEWEESQVTFSAQELNLPELGFMIENQLIQRGLWLSMGKEVNIDSFLPDGLQRLSRTEEGWQVTLQSGRELLTRLVVGADGAESEVRRQVGIGITGWQYRQSCLLIGVQTEYPAHDCTWQRFYPSGPRAYLPLHDHYASLAWYDHPQRIRQLQSLPLTVLNQEIAQHFPASLGAVSAYRCAAFPLIRRHAQSYAREGVVLLGDAAHTINPLAGQGVNLGYRDAEALLEVLNTARQAGECWYGNPILQRYQHKRHLDNLLMQTAMDLFYKTFSHSAAPIEVVRNLALQIAGRAQSLKKRALRYALGL